ncbi:MAG: hypothetical protein LC667_19840 [Thioalkalivibrio sp.]|nr:hypothetical protein [Thioalkalivibrio sp.]
MSRRGFPFRIFSLLRAAWASFWIFGIPKDFWGLLCVWPTLFLAVSSYLWEPSEQGLRLILLAAVWDVVMGFWLTLSAMNTTQNALIATIARLRDSTYTPLEWDRILNLRPDAGTMIDRSSRISYLGRQGLPYDHSKDVRFFRVGMGDSGAIPCGLGVFNIPFSETVILVRDDPEDATVKERFSMYHEIGHSLGIEFAMQSALNLTDVLPEDQELSRLEHETRIVAARAFLQTGVDLTQSHPGMSPWGFILETQLAALNLGAWMIMLAGLIGAPGPEVAEGFKWLVVTVVILTVLRYAKHSVNGSMVESIFSGRARWHDGRFRPRMGHQSPASVPTA